MFDHPFLLPPEGRWKMATSEQVERAIARVAAGKGSAEDIRLTQGAAKQAGQRGGRAQRALEGRR